MLQDTTDTHTKKSKAPLLVSLGLVVVLVLSYFLVPSMNDFFNDTWATLKSGDEKRIREWVSGFGWWGPLILVLVMVLQMFLLVIPSLALMVVAILAYGPIWGSLIVFVSIFAASSVGYWIGRYFGPVLVKKLLGDKAHTKMAHFIGDYGFWAIIITRLNPFLSNDAISFVGGILRMGYWKFMGASLLGIAPLTIFIAVLGKSTDSLQTGLLWGSLIGLVLFGLYVYWDRKKRK